MMIDAIPDGRLPTSSEESTHVMAIKALAEPQTLSRIIGVFALYDVIPTLVSAQRQGSFVIVDIAFAAAVSAADRLLAKVQSMVLV